MPIESLEKRIIRRIIELVGTVLIVITTLLWCCSMTIYSDSVHFLDDLINLVMLLCIILGVVTSIIKWKENDRTIFLLTIAFFAARLLSYRVNGLQITYGGNMMLQMFYLFGINKHIWGGKIHRYAAISSFVAFDIIAIFVCWYNYHFRYEYAMMLFDKYWKKGMNVYTTLFQNPNYPGLMIGAVVIFCCAALMNKKNKRKTTFILIPIIIINLYMLFAYTGCRSAETGLILVALLGALINLLKKQLSVRKIVCVSLLLCSLTMVPLYAVVFQPNNSQYLDNVSSTEKLLESVSSGRYSIWKTTLLSQKGHMAFGYGNISTASSKKKEFVENFDQERVSEDYRYSIVHVRQHNGYLAAINETGLVGAVLLLMLLLRKAWCHVGSFADGQWEYLVLPYLFWINLFEAKFINTMFFTGLLMMTLLLPNKETKDS